MLQSPRFLEQPAEKMLITFIQHHLLEFLVPAVVSLQSTAQSLLKAGNSKDPNNLRPKFHSHRTAWVGKDHEDDPIAILCHGQEHLPPGQALCYQVLFSKNSCRQSLEKTTAHLL